MRILIVSATQKEIQPLLDNLHRFSDVEILITGPGMISTTYHLTKKLTYEKYDLIINAGIAGSFSEKLKLGEVVKVEQDCFSELGAEDDEDFIPLSQMNLIGEDKFPLQKLFLKNDSVISNNLIKQLPMTKAITVNTVHGNEKSITRIKKIYNPDIETMEGAAFFYVCDKAKTSFTQLRCISNYVEKRDRSKWEIEEAISNLNIALEKILTEIIENSKPV